MGERITKVDKFIRWCKNHKWISVVIIAGLIILVLGQFTDALGKIHAFFKSSSAPPLTQPTQGMVNSPGGMQAGRDIINYINSGSTTNSSSETGLKWQPPELPEGCKNVYLIFAGNSTEMTIDEIKTATYMSIGGFEPVKWRVNSNRFYIDVDIPMGREVIKVRGGQFSPQLPPKWDMNFNSNAVEIVAGNNNPLYQVVYRRPDQVVVNGIFAQGGFLFAATTNGLEYWTGESNIITNLRGFFSGAQPTGLKPIFKYPAYQHLGQYAD